MLSQMPVTFEDVALYLSHEEWGRLDHTQQNFYKDVLQEKNGLALGKGSSAVAPSCAFRNVPPYPPLSSCPLFSLLCPVVPSTQMEMSASV